MKTYPETEEWMKYAIIRTNQIRESDDIYQLDSQRVQIYYDELNAVLNYDYQQEMLEEYKEHMLMREDELALAIYRAAFEDVLRILKNVSFMPELTE